MARLTDFPHAIRTLGALGFVKRLYQQVSEDALFTHAAAMAYAWIFAVFPFLIFLLTLAPHLPRDATADARAAINGFASTWLAREAADTFRQSVDQVMDEPRGGLLSLGLVLTLYAASGGMATTMASLDRCYDVEKPRSFVRARGVAVALTLGVAVLVLAVITLLPIGTLVANQLTHRLPWGARLVVDAVRYSLGAALLLLGVGLIYHYGPSLRRRFHVVTPGAVFSLVFWMLLGLGFRVYTDRFGDYNKTYGAVGGVAILLSLFYLTSLVLLIGAELDSEIDFVVLGVARKSGEDAPVPPPETIADPETRELAEELLARRGPTDAPGDAPPTEEEKAEERGVS